MADKDSDVLESILPFAVILGGLYLLQHHFQSELTFAIPSVMQVIAILLLLGIICLYSLVTNLSRADRESKAYGNWITGQLELIERRFLATCIRTGVPLSISSSSELTKLRERTRSLSPTNHGGQLGMDANDEIESAIGLLETLVFHPRDSCGIVEWIGEVNDLCLELAESIECRERLLVVHP